MQAAFLDGARSGLAARGREPRAILADWMTSPDNPYFARAAVNRVWAHLFGVGLVDPVDDMGGGQPAEPPRACSTPWPVASWTMAST